MPRIDRLLSGINNKQTSKMNTETKKVLIGWTEINPITLLAGTNIQSVTPEHHSLIQKAELAKKARSKFVNPTGVIKAPPAELSEYITGFWAQPALQPFIQEGGWSIQVADLKKLCTIQPVVETVKSKQRVANASSTDVVSIAQITLPYDNIVQQVPGAFDAGKNAFVFSSPNPNLRIAGTVVNNGVFGFAVTMANSYVQVAKCQGRYFLRDGHHRSYGLLANDISNVPVLFKEFDTFSQMNLPQGLFPTEILNSSHPPMLIDFFDESVSSDAQFPISTKVVMIQALEVGTIAA